MITESTEQETLQDQVDEKASTLQQKYGTFGGIFFVPALLTILGVILFLRKGWVIGNAGMLRGC